MSETWLKKVIRSNHREVSCVLEETLQTDNTAFNTLKLIETNERVNSHNNL